MKKFVETITLTRESYDELKSELTNVKEYHARFMNYFANRLKDIDKLKDTVWGYFLENNLYDFNRHGSYENFMEDFNKKTNKNLYAYYIEEYCEIDATLGHEFIEKKVKEYYDNANEKSKN
jgi:hypothetical protein